MLSTLSASPGVNSIPSMSTSVREKKKVHKVIFGTVQKQDKRGETVYFHPTVGIFIREPAAPVGLNPDLDSH